MRKFSATLLMLFSAFVVRAQEPLPEVVSGYIERIESFQSDYVTSRNIDIWLPEGYSESKKYAVLYMHDGQMLFDPNKSWNKQAWDIDDTATDLMRKGKVKEFIVVGIWNGGITRHPDYFPQKPFESLSGSQKDTVTAQLQRASRQTSEAFRPQSDNYLKFIVQELKPYIDKKYSAYSNRENTFIAGSSMGGLISIYAICEYPEVFGGAAALSTHWPGTFTLDNNPVPESFLKYLQRNLPDPKKNRIYFDTGDQTLDSLYPEIQKKVDQIMISKGFEESNWLTKYFPGENHTEDAWSKRLNIPLEFLLKK